MKKILILINIFIIIFATIFTVKSNAAEIVNINTSINKTIVNPEDTIVLTIAFDKPLASYTLDILYDDNLLEYQSASEGSVSDLTNGIRVIYYNATTPSNGLTVTFRAKAGITTSSKTNFAVTGTGLANISAEAYEDVVSPVNKEFTVEPVYTDYTISLGYDGTILPNVEKQIKIGTTSPMGRYYDHVRLVAELIKPVGSTVKITGMDTSSVEHDLIVEGWGIPEGYSIGGKDFVQEYEFKSLFDTEGAYKLTLRLVDLDTSVTIAQQSFDIAVGEQFLLMQSNEQVQQQVGESASQPAGQSSSGEALPQQLPATGYDVSTIVGLSGILNLLLLVCYINKKNR